METNCSECGMAHEVGESQKNAYMFCLGCDKFFKVEEKTKTPKNEDDLDAVFKESVDSLNKREKNSVNKKLKTAFKKLFVIKKKSAVPESETVLEADPPKMSEAYISTKTKGFALIDDFLDPESDFEDQPEDVPAEYIDFLSVGLDVSSSDFLENHGKNKADEHTPQKEQE